MDTVNRERPSAIQSDRSAGPDQSDPLALGRTVADEELACSYLPLARALAGRFAGKGVELDDLVQVANLALVKAVRRYDPEQGAFAPFASATISGELKKHLRDHCWMVKPPRSIQELQGRIMKVVDSVAQEDRGQPHVASLAAAVDVSVGEAREAMKARACFSPASLDRPSPVTGRSLGESLSDDDGAFEEIEGHLALVQICSDLTPAERQLIRLRYYENKSQREIARELGVSQMQVSRRLRRLLDDLRARAGEFDVAS